MEPFFVSVMDNNVEHHFNEGDTISDCGKDSKIDFQNTSDQLSCNAKCMFPNKIKYIFDDDLVERGNNSVEGDIILDDEDLDYENIIIIDMDENHHVLNLNLISDKYQLLKYDIVGDAEDRKSLEKSYKEINIEVVSKFRNLSNVAKDLPLNKLIDIYNIQNTQLQSLYDSI